MRNENVKNEKLGDTWSTGTRAIFTMLAAENDEEPK